MGAIVAVIYAALCTAAPRCLSIQAIHQLTPFATAACPWDGLRRDP